MSVRAGPQRRYVGRWYVNPHLRPADTPGHLCATIGGLKNVGLNDILNAVAFFDLGKWVLIKLFGWTTKYAITYFNLGKFYVAIHWLVGFWFEKL